MRLILTCMLLLWAAVAEAKPFCVNASTGSDATAYASLTTAATDGTGTCTATLRRAANVALAGDIIYVAPGTYNTAGTSDRWVSSLNPTNEGTVGNPITFIGVSYPTLGLSSGTGPMIGCSARDYITWRGFNIDEANGTSRADTGPVVGHDSTGCVFEENLIDGNGNGHGDPDNHNGVRLEACLSCVVRNNAISHVTSAAAVNGSCVTMYGSSNSIVEHNSCDDTGTAFYFKDTATQLQSGIHLRYNIASNASSFVRFSHARTGDGQNFVYQNIGHTIDFGIAFVALGAHGDWVYNNTFYNLAGALVFVGTTSGYDGRLWNNVCVDCDVMLYGSGVAFPAEGVLDVEHNAYFTYTNFKSDSGGNQTFAAYNAANPNQNQASPASINANPLYANAAGLDFRLCTSAGVPHASCSGASPALAIGVDSMDLDNDGSTSDNIPAGAYVTGSEVIGVDLDAVLTVPDAPTVGTATPSNARCSITFTPPVDDGGATITGYIATSSPGSLTGTSTGSPVSVTGLTNGQAYTFTIVATNSEGNSVASSASNSCTPALISGPNRVRIVG